MKVDQKLKLEAKTEPVVVVDSDGKRRACNEELAELLKKDKEDIIGTTICENIAGNGVKDGIFLQKVINGKTVTETGTATQSNGSIIETTNVGEPIEVGGETLVMITVTDTEKIKPANPDSGNRSLNSNKFEDLSTDELQEIVQNIRIDSPKGKITLNEVMLDLAVGHNQIEQYKNGGLSLQKAVDQRLKEEEKDNPDSKGCAVLREVRDSAFGLYLRIQRGDKELHGNREGEYSGYFN